MYIITKSSELEETFTACLKKHDFVSFLVAWAGINSVPFTELFRNQEKIIEGVIGTHFYQTSPDFIESFIDNARIKFVKPTNGVFHPKVYVFYSTSGQFDCLVGSANLTNAAFTKNIEVTTRFTSEDVDASIAFDDLRNLIAHWFKQAEYFSAAQLSIYRTIWKLQQGKIEGLSGRYGGRKSSVDAFFNSSIAAMTWREYIQAIKKNDVHGIKERLVILDTCRELFESVDNFSELSDESRKFIAGVDNNLPIAKEADWAFFGSMVGRGDFVNRIHKNDPLISSALAHIPLHGKVTKRDFESFVHDFKTVFPGNYVGCASRLLAMKRPDIFYCLTKANKRKFCDSFGLSKTNIDFEVYWDAIISRLKDCPWFADPEPINDIEVKISNAKSAFLDAIFYQENKR